MKQAPVIILGVLIIAVIIGIVVLLVNKQSATTTQTPIPVEKKAASTTYTRTIDLGNGTSSSSASLTVTPASASSDALFAAGSNPTPTLAFIATPTIVSLASQDITPTEIPLVPANASTTITTTPSPTKAGVSTLPQSGWTQATMALIGFAGAVVVFSFLF